MRPIPGHANRQARRGGDSRPDYADLIIDVDPALGVTTTGTLIDQIVSQVPSADVFVGSGASRPNLTATDALFNSKPSLVFTGAEGLLSGTVAASSAANITIACVSYRTGGTNGIQIGGNFQLRTPELRGGSVFTGGASGYDLDTFTEDELTTKVRKIAVFRFGSAATDPPLVWRDGSALTLTNTNNTATNTTCSDFTWKLGGFSGSAYQGRIARIMVWKGDKSSVRTSIDSYLVGLYG